MDSADADRVPYALVVDDDAIIRMDAADILCEAGFRTFEACDGDEAVGLLESAGPSIALLFTDVEMPGSRNGFALARETAARWPDITIVVASGKMKPTYGEMPEGARFIGKPFSAELVRNHDAEILPNGRKPEPMTRSSA